jgi:hypothetical protein
VSQITIFVPVWTFVFQKNYFRTEGYNRQVEQPNAGFQKRHNF